MRRRDLFSLAVSAAALAGFAARAQQKPFRRVGMLHSSSLSEPAAQGIRTALGEAGYVEGRNLDFEYRWAEGNYDRLPGLVADLVTRNVDAILAFGPSGFTRPSERPRQFLWSLPAVATRFHPDGSRA